MPKTTTKTKTTNMQIKVLTDKKVQAIDQNFHSCRSPRMDSAFKGVYVRLNPCQHRLAVPKSSKKTNHSSSTWKSNIFDTLQNLAPAVQVVLCGATHLLLLCCFLSHFSVVQCCARNYLIKNYIWELRELKNVFSMLNHNLSLNLTVQLRII